MAAALHNKALRGTGSRTGKPAITVVLGLAMKTSRCLSSRGGYAQENQDGNCNQDFWFEE